jgi:hypothetical protein
MNSDDLPAAADSAVHPALRGALARQGYDTLTAVQLAVLAEETRDVDLLVSAQTGSRRLPLASPSRRPFWGTTSASRPRQSRLAW